MKLLIKIFIAVSVLTLILFLWQEWPDWSITKKINADKVAAFFTAISSLLTAITVYLLYKQIKEQIEDRKATSRPDLFPEDQFFTLTQQTGLPKLSREGKQDVLNGLFNLRNIGLGAAKEIKAKWYFQKEVLTPLVDDKLLTVYINRATETDYSFVSSNNLIEIPFPIMYVASLNFFKDEWAEMIWEELFLELSYKDIHDHSYIARKFKVIVYAGKHYARFNFSRVNEIKLSNQSTMISRILTADR